MFFQSKNGALSDFQLQLSFCLPLPVRECHCLIFLPCDLKHFLIWVTSCQFVNLILILDNQTNDLAPLLCLIVSSSLWMFLEASLFSAAPVQTLPLFDRCLFLTSELVSQFGFHSLSLAAWLCSTSACFRLFLRQLGLKMKKRNKRF